MAIESFGTLALKGSANVCTITSIQARILLAVIVIVTSGGLAVPRNVDLTLADITPFGACPDVFSALVGTFAIACTCTPWAFASHAVVLSGTFTSLISICSNNSTFETNSCARSASERIGAWLVDIIAGLAVIADEGQAERAGVTGEVAGLLTVADLAIVAGAVFRAAPGRRRL